MMLDINIAALREGFIRYLPVGIIVGLVILAEIIAVILQGKFGPGGQLADLPAHAADYSNTKELGRVLYTVYVYPFEIASVILLVAIIAAITLTMRRRPDAKAQNISSQVLVRRDDRVRLVKMPSNKKI